MFIRNKLFLIYHTLVKLAGFQFRTMQTMRDIPNSIQHHYCVCCHRRKVAPPTDRIVIRVIFPYPCSKQRVTSRGSGLAKSVFLFGIPGTAYLFTLLRFMRTYTSITLSHMIPAGFWGAPEFDHISIAEFFQITLQASLRNV